MSNCPRFEVPTLELVGWHHLSSALRCILHTIVLTRSLEKTVPQERYERGLDVTYGTVDDEGVEQYVRQKIQEFVLWLQRHSTNVGALKLTFHDKAEKLPPLFGDALTSCWEEWTISVHVVEEGAPASPAEIRQRVTSCLEYVTSSVMLHAYPVPCVGKVSLLQSFRVGIVMNSKAAEMFHAIHRALQDINTTSLLR